MNYEERYNSGSGTCEPRTVVSLKYLKSSWIINVLAKHVQLRFPEEVVAIFTDAVQTGEDALIVDALALDIEERSFAQRMTVEGGGVRAQADAG